MYKQQFLFGPPAAGAVEGLFGLDTCSGPGISKYEWWNALVLLCSEALTSTALECWKPVL